MRNIDRSQSKILLVQQAARFELIPEHGWRDFDHSRGQICSAQYPGRSALIPEPGFQSLDTGIQPGLN